MANKRMTTPTRSANIAASVVTSLIIVLMGVLMILSAVEVIAIDIGKFWLPALLIAIFLIGVVLGICRRETGFLWFGCVALVCAIAVIANLAAGAPYARIYPLFIAAPAFASLVALFFADNKKLHLQGIILFGGLAAIFLLQSLGAIRNALIVAGIAVVMVGLFFFVNVVTSRRGRWDDGDRPQRQRGKRWDDGDEPHRKKRDADESVSVEPQDEQDK